MTTVPNIAAVAELELQIFKIEQMMNKERIVETSKEAGIVGNTVLAVVAIDAQKNCRCKDELYANWYDCPNCDNNNVLYHDNYCSKCGCKFEWSGDYR